MSRLSGTAAAILALALVPAAPAADETWITLERGTAQQALVGLAAAGHPGALVVVDGGRPEALGTAARESDVVVRRISVSDVELLPEILHAARKRCGGFMRHATRDEAERAAQASDPEHRTLPPPIGYTIDNGPVVQAMLPQIKEPGIRNTMTSLSSFFTRRHTCPSGLQSATWIHNRWQAIAASRPDVTVDYYDHVVTNQPSVILTIPGSTLPSEVVVLGARQDSTSGSNCSNNRAPGSDDDASGVASLTEVLKVALHMGYKPLRTVKFMAYAAEESGLLGSDEIAQAYKNQNVNVVGVLQLDMTNFKGSTGDIYIITDFTNPAQNTFVRDLMTTYAPGLVKGNSFCGYACSDHASWTARGYPASFPFESTFDQSNPFIHTPLDDLAHSGGTAKHSVKFSRLAVAYMAEVAKGGFTSH